jgi:hypothetical protein
VSHALLFSFSGWLFAALLGATFTLGMVLTDALNGLWVAKMMAGPAAASRWLGGAVAFLCFLIAALGFVKHLVAPLSLPLGIATVVLITAVAVLRSRSVYREARS